ncbi:hypothetical protein HX109_16065 [Galbibacter sp. BG1]|uniref:hypothetical protein n=1 Tax=Galbibacter sp. BG1 TaxID=1170699 RepID=UPI0015BB196C|nr:hypothetical protein [Galbibacter sp. BG1]QLE03011.1 hypothetical protein HX109_16065 [Galbibacter sp. BG1]
MKTIKLLTYFLAGSILLTSCSDDDDDGIEPVNPEEVITDVTLKFTDSDGMSKTYTYTDPLYREDSYVDPQIMLDADMSYDVEVSFLNNSNPDDPENVTEEVIEEKDEHFVEYAFVTANVTLTRASDDITDSNDVKIGIFTDWASGAASEGTVQVTLIHEPESKDTSNPNGSHTGGEVDVEVPFAITIQ